MKHTLSLLLAVVSGLAAAQKNIRASLDQLNSVARLALVGRVTKVEEVSVPWTSHDGLKGSSKASVVTLTYSAGGKAVASRLLATSFWTPWLEGRTYFVLACRPESGRLRFFPPEVRNGRIDFPGWAQADALDGSVVAAVVVDSNEHLGERAGNKMQLLASYVVKRFGQEPYSGIQAWIQKLLDFGLCYPTELDPITAKWFKCEFAEEASAQVKKAEPRIRAAVFGFLLSLGVPKSTDYWIAIRDLMKQNKDQKVLLDVLNLAHSTVGSTVFPLIRSVPRGPVRDRLIHCLGGVAPAEVETAVSLFGGPLAEDTATLLDVLAISAQRPDLRPKILRYRDGLPQYEDMSQLMRLWRENPPTIPPKWSDFKDMSGPWGINVQASVGLEIESLRISEVTCSAMAKSMKFDNTQHPLASGEVEPVPTYGPIPAEGRGGELAAVKRLAHMDLLRFSTAGSVDDGKRSETAVEDRKRQGYF